MLGTGLAVFVLTSPVTAIDVGQPAPGFTMVNLITDEPFSYWLFFC